jgi:uncharacterized repeat protein (TIGR02543 family)
MVYCESAQWKAAAPQIRMEITITAETGSNATYKWELYYVASSPAKTVISRPYTATIDGKQVASGNYDINNVTGKKLITSGTVTIAKQSSSRWWPFGCTMDMGITWSGVYKGVVSASNTVGIRAITTYTISYNANGGSGAPSSQTKTHGTNLKLSTSIPNRAGYIFAGWSSTSTGAVKWSAGGTYSTDSSATLYAVWTPSSYTITYNANGGTGQPANQTKSHGVKLTLSSTVPTRKDHNFLGWSLSSNATTATWPAGGTYTENASNTLYAVWKISYILPKVSNLKIARTDADGNLTDNGTYMGIEFNYQCSQPSTNVVISWNSGQDSGSATFALNGGLTGEFLRFVGEGTLNPERNYSIAITVADTVGSTVLYRTLSGTSYPIDFKAGGTGVAFGKPAETDGLFDCNYDASFRKSLSVGGCRVRAKRCIVGNNTRVSTHKWFKFASTTIDSYLTGDRILVFRVTWAFGPETQSAVFNVFARHYSGGAFTDIKFYSESCSTINPEIFRLLYGQNDLELWVYCYEWRTCRVEILSESNGVDETFEDWTLYNLLGDYGVESPTTYLTPVKPSTYLDTIYPINSIYISYSHTSPASLFGGTWVRITESFLWATSSGGIIGQTGGESKHTLTVNEIPSHSHQTGIQDGKAMNYTDGTRSAVVLYDQTTGLYTNSTGGGQAHNNMPPYTQVSIWRRIDPNDAVG